MTPLTMNAIIGKRPGKHLGPLLPGPPAILQGAWSKHDPQQQEMQGSQRRS
jgi:hypothetical protein